MDFADAEASWRAWRLWQATGILPYAGGTLDQPEALMDDLLTWEFAEQRWKANHARS